MAESLEYERRTDAAGGDILEVRPEGVVVRLPPPSVAVEVLNALVVAAGTVVFAGVTILAMSSPAGVAGAVVGFVLFLLLVLLSAASTLQQWRRLLAVVRGDPSTVTLFLAAADADFGLDVDPVIGMGVWREPRQANLKRPLVLRVRTRGGRDYRLFRDRPVAELEALEQALRPLLRLNALPTHGFPVLPSETNDNPA